MAYDPGIGLWNSMNIERRWACFPEIHHLDVITWLKWGDSNIHALISLKGWSPAKYVLDCYRIILRSSTHGLRIYGSRLLIEVMDLSYHQRPGE